MIRIRDIFYSLIWLHHFMYRKYILVYETFSLQITAAGSTHHEILSLLKLIAYNRVQYCIQ